MSPPGWHAVDVVPQWPEVQVPEQHWDGAVQLVVSGRQLGPGSVQIPLAHEFVQQFASEPQACPTLLQVVGVTQVPLHAPLQHSEGSVQVVPSSAQLVVPQVPPVHFPVQHSDAAEQGTPSLLQLWAVPQTPVPRQE